MQQAAVLGNKNWSPTEDRPRREWYHSIITRKLARNCFDNNALFSSKLHIYSVFVLLDWFVFLDLIYLFPRNTVYGGRKIAKSCSRFKQQLTICSNIVQPTLAHLQLKLVRYKIGIQVPG
jgi:hypothetical protein